ncbi:hypothetical protein TYRP_004431 [Tyrophagus putrescentiae]|nr:hypothetical protein TYRP_004431 [Tyrophagus putrescentiae]
MIIHNGATTCFQGASPTARIFSLGAKESTHPFLFSISLAHNTVESNAIDHQLQYAVSRALFSSLLQSPFAASPPI